MALVRCVRTVDPEAVARPRSHGGQVAVPVERGALRHRDARLVVLVVEQAQLHAAGMFGEQREVGTAAIPRRAEREGTAGPDLDLAQATSAPDSGSSSTAPPAIAGSPCVANSTLVPRQAID